LLAYVVYADVEMLDTALATTLRTEVISPMPIANVLMFGAFRFVAFRIVICIAFAEIGTPDTREVVETEPAETAPALRFVAVMELVVSALALNALVETELAFNVLMFAT
jgi:hypothetical protein